MRTRLLLIIAIIALSCLGVAAQPSDTLRVMTFNLHAGHDATLERIAGLIKRERPDFVALQEVDHRTRRGNSPHQNGRDFITELAYHSGMQGLFCPAIEFSGGLYGIGLLTRHPFVEARNHKLPHPVASKEQRVLIEGTFVLPGGDTIIVAGTHFEAFDSLSRVEQARFVNALFTHARYPAIIAGDFNATPDDDAMRSLTACWLDCTGPEPTFSVKSPSKKIDYILARPKSRWQIVETRVLPDKLSDHFAVITTLIMSHR